MRYNRLITSAFIVLLLLLVGCSNEGVNEYDEDYVVVDLSEESLNDLKEEQSELSGIGLSLDEFKYSDYELDEEIVNFYKSKEIFYGEEKIQDEDKYLIYVFSPACIYSKGFFSVLEEYLEDDLSYPMYNINVMLSDNEDFIYDYGIEATPTLLLYDKEKDEIEEFLVGIQDLDDMPYNK